MSEMQKSPCGVKVDSTSKANYIYNLEQIMDLAVGYIPSNKLENIHERGAIGIGVSHSAMLVCIRKRAGWAASLNQAMAKGP